MASVAGEPQRAAPGAHAGLRVRSVSHRFPDGFQMESVSLDVAPGELVCLLGPSGCGKSTLLRLVAGLETVQSGAICIDGQTVAGDGARRPVPPEHRGVGLMFQDYALFPHLSVFENISFGLEGRSSEARRRWVRGRLSDMGLEDLSARYPHTLSGGQQQRIALLRALAPEPSVMLLDEPFSGLDEHLRQQVRQETLNILKEIATATLLVTHDPEEAMYLADRLVIMDHGRIVQDAPPVDIYHQPGTAFIAGLFGPMNTFQGSVRERHVSTPLGSVPAPGLAEGARVRVLVRACGIHLDPAAGHDAIRARVRASRPLGQSSQVLVSLDPGGEALELRLPGIQLPSPGSLLGLRVDEREVFVFAD